MDLRELKAMLDFEHTKQRLICTDCGTRFRGVEVQPCPFCGSTAKMMKAGALWCRANWIECSNDECVSNVKFHGNKKTDLESMKKKLSKAWNTRTKEGINGF